MCAIKGIRLCFAALKAAAKKIPSGVAAAKMYLGFMIFIL
jgi:hypothetical protein